MAETWLVDYTLAPRPVPLPPDYEIIEIVWNGGNYSGNEVWISGEFVPRQRVSFARSDNIMIEWIAASQNYRGSNIVTFETAPTGALLTWLQTHAVKQEDPPTEIKNIKIGQVTPAGIFIGENEVDAGYVGSTKVWEKSEEPIGKNWVINNTVTINRSIDQIINFTSVGVAYNRFTMVGSAPSRIEYGGYGLPNIVYLVGAGWSNQGYRNVIFETEPTGDLLAWLQANAVKQ